MSVHDAISHFEKLVAQVPDDAAAHHNLANMLLAAQRVDEAIAHYRCALRLNPDQVETHVNCGNALRRQNREQDAVACYERAIALRPDLPEAYINLGNTLNALKRGPEAVRHFEAAIALRPDLAEAHYNLGQTLLDLDRFEDALAPTQAAIALRPDFAEAHHNMGIALQHLDRQDEAIRHFETVLALDPRYHRAHNSLGTILHDLQRYDDAIRHYETAHAIAPDYAEVLINLGYVYNEVGRHAEAVAALERALALAPDNIQAHLNAGSAFAVVQDYDRAFRHLDRALALDPKFIPAQWNKSILSLSFGHFPEGWELYESRFLARLEGVHTRAYPQPRWRGGRVDGTLLLWGEQGLGEQILYAGMVPELIDSAGRIVLEVDHRLVPLFARSFPRVHVLEMRDRLYGGDVDAQLAMGSIGGIVRRSWQAFSRREGAYLIADAARTHALRARLGRGGETVVGLSWRSHHPRHADSKTARLIDFAPILRLPGTRFVDLQYGDTQAERSDVEQQTGVRVERLHDIDNRNDIDGLAALISACDIVMTVSNTTAHLAGALGRPTWVLLPYGWGRLWHWFHDRADSPWYPDVRLHRLTRWHGWPDAVASAARELDEFLAAH